MKQLWILYSLIGTGGFLISFSMEYIILESITGKSGFSFCLTLVLESAKVLTVIFHRLISDRKGYEIPGAVSSLNTFFKFGLVFLSLICSVAMISKGLDKPNLDTVRNDDQLLITSSFEEKTALIESRREKRLDKITSEIKGKYRNRYKELDNQYLPKIQQKERLRDAEFRNIRGGIRKGPFWNEHNRQLQELKAEYKTEKDALRFSENTELDRNINSIEAEFQEKLDNSLNDKESALTAINKADYKKDERVKNEIVSAFLATIDQGLGLGMSYLSFALLFSLLTSTLLELTIFLSFSYITMFYSNVLNPAEEELDSINQVTHPPEPEVNSERETPKEPINDENFYVHRDFDPSMANYFQHLQNQFQTSDTPQTDFDNPCGQEGIP